MTVAPRAIICDRCNKPVEQTIEQDFFVGVFTKQFTRISVYCHGEKQSVDITLRDLEHAQQIDFGRAFVQPKQLGSGT